jgi:hypothetical protein
MITRRLADGSFTSRINRLGAWRAMTVGRGCDVPRGLGGRRAWTLRNACGAVHQVGLPALPCEAYCLSANLAFGR